LSSREVKIAFFFARREQLLTSQEVRRGSQALQLFVKTFRQRDKKRG